MTGPNVTGLSLTDAGIRIDDRWLVRHVSLSLVPGRLTALAGPNGSGKSTLLRLVSGLWTATEGKVELDGRPLRSYARRELARRIAIVPQDTHVAFAFTVRETVAMGRHAHVSRFAREDPSDRQAIDDAMARADISDLADRLVTELSGGERQRVLIARSLATEAETILLDEPTANLDIAHALDVLTLCRTLADEGRAIVVALHDLNAAATYATHAVLMKAGTVAAIGTARDLLAPDAIRDVFGVGVEEVISSGGRTLFAFTPLQRASTHDNMQDCAHDSTGRR